MLFSLAHVNATESDAARRTGELLAALIEPNEAPQVTLTTGGRDRGFDFEIQISKWLFLAEWKASATTPAVLQAVHGLNQIPRASFSVPLVVVPFMGQAGKRVCADGGVSWLDLSGNADIRGPGLRVLAEGKPNQWVRRGRPADIFAPKSSRVARYFLMQPNKPVGTKREIARATKLDEGFVSRIVKRHIAAGYLKRDSTGAVSLRDPKALLDDWREAYEFSRHRTVAGFTIARSSEELARGTALRLEQLGVGYAATGLAGAWLLAPFASFRLVTFLVDRALTPHDLKVLEVRDEPLGANTWLVTPNDLSVFEGAAVRDGVRCAHPLQVYLDLKGHPERSEEAAQELRREQLPWTLNG